MRTVRRICAWTGLLVAALVSGCAASTSPGEGSYFILCHLAFEVHVTPEPATLAVGDSLVLQAHFGVQDDCAPPAPDGPTAWRWSSGDTSIAVVDSVRGVVSSRAAGTVVVRARNAASPLFADSVRVQVTDRPRS
jgi:hypothetical protein